MKRIKLKIGELDDSCCDNADIINIPYSRGNLVFLMDYLMNLKNEFDEKDDSLIQLRSSIEKTAKGISADNLVIDSIEDSDEDSDKIPKGFDDFKDWMDQQGAEFSLSDYQSKSKVSDYLLNRYGYWIVKEDLAYQVNADRFHKK